MTASDGRAFVAWARRGAVVQGGRLVDHIEIGDPVRADDILAEAEQLGWITQAKHEPTPEQRFFRTSGHRTREFVAGAAELFRRDEYAWEVTLAAPVWP